MCTEIEDAILQFNQITAFTIAAGLVNPVNPASIQVEPTSGCELVNPALNQIEPTSGSVLVNRIVI